MLEVKKIRKNWDTLEVKVNNLIGSKEENEICLPRCGELTLDCSQMLTQRLTSPS